jgi:DNA-binding transcriptional regulator YiaG
MRALGDARRMKPSLAEDVRQVVGTNVRRVRLAKKLTQTALAARLGVDRAYVSSLETGRRNPTIVTSRPLTSRIER